MNKKEAAYYPPRWHAPQKMKVLWKVCMRALAKWWGTGRIAGISLSMHHRRYLWPMPQNTTSSRPLAVSEELSWAWSSW